MRSYLVSARDHGIRAIDAIRMVLTSEPWLPVPRAASPEPAALTTWTNINTAPKKYSPLNGHFLRHGHTDIVKKMSFWHRRRASDGAGNFAHPGSPAAPAAPADERTRTAALLEELVAIGKSQGFLASGEARTRAIGAELDRTGGMDAMRAMHQMVDRRLPPGYGRELDYAWDGVGDWLG